MNFNPERQIAIIWSIEDVQDIRPDLSDGQAMTVLLEIEKSHDSEYGVTWDTIENTANIFFPYGK